MTARTLQTPALGERLRRRLVFKYREWETALYGARLLDRRDLALPDFIVIGARKCGTTWLYENLRAHPGLFLAEGKGLEFFNKHLDRGVRYYASRFESGAGRLKGEVCGAYSFMPRERIRCLRRLVPEVRLVLLVRNPIHRAWSQACMHLLAQAGRTLEEVSESEMRAFLGSDFVLRSGRYTAMLENWLSVFPREQLHLGLFEDIAGRPESLLRAVLRHVGASLDVDWSRFPLHDTILPPAGAQFAHCDPGRGVKVAGHEPTDKTMPRPYRDFLREQYRNEIETLAGRYGLPVTGWLAD